MDSQEQIGQKTIIRKRQLKHLQRQIMKRKIAKTHEPYRPIDKTILQRRTFQASGETSEHFNLLIKTRLLSKAPCIGGDLAGHDDVNNPPSLSWSL